MPLERAHSSPARRRSGEVQPLSDTRPSSAVPRHASAFSLDASGANEKNDEPRARGATAAAAAPATTSGRALPACAALLTALIATLLWRGRALTPGITTGAPATCAPATAPARAALFSDLGGFASPFAAALPTPAAQAAFDTGLLLASGFHRAAALASFAAAADAAPLSPLPLWGRAYALGPGANRAPSARTNASFPAFTPADWEAAGDAARRAVELADGADAFTAGAASAMAARYGPGTSPADGERAWAATERAFADAMASLAVSAAPSQPAAAWALALAAEARANPVQWAHVRPGAADLAPPSAAALDLVAAALASDPTNPLALHLAIHLTEALPPSDARHAALGLPAADALSRPGPWAAAPVPHLLHMAGHAYARAGRWAQAVTAGDAAMAADAALGGACVESYAVEHNAAAAAHAANLGGDAPAAARAAAFAAAAPDTAGPAMLYAGGSREATLLTWHRVMFAEWRAILGSPRPGPAARGLCLAGGAEFAAAVDAWARVMADAAGVAAGTAPRSSLSASVAALHAAASAIPPEPETRPGPPPGLYACGHAAVVGRAVRIATARIAALDGELSRAAALLKAVAEEEASDGFVEPPRSPFPARPCAGWAAAQAGDVDGAEAQFRLDLAERPHHARSLVGLAGLARARGDGPGAAALEEAAAAAWAGARPPRSACPAFSEL